MRVVLGLWLLAAAFFVRPAAAYPFMIGHGYTGCAQCHVDPSGGNALTDYGRGQAEIFMRSVYRKRPADYDPGSIAKFAFGVPLPKWLTLQEDTRSLIIPEPGNFRFILMQADLRTALKFDKFTAYGTIGYVSEGGYGAWFTSNTGSGGNVVSREHWLGYAPVKGLLVRAGRMALPFGIRSEEHILFARSATRTDSNDDQQLGLDAVYGKGKIRAEVMGIAGNFQLGPDDYRERGYSALFGYALNNNTEVGVSSLFTHANLDIDLAQERTRQAHGAFFRYAPIEAVRFLTEADLTLSSVAGAENDMGSVGYLQVDTEPAQGFHVKATGEWCDDNHADTADPTLRASLTTLWFFAPHADVRMDALYGTLYCTPGVDPTPMGLVQLHMFL